MATMDYENENGRYDGKLPICSGKSLFWYRDILIERCNMQRSQDMSVNAIVVHHHALPSATIISVPLAIEVLRQMLV